MTGANGQLGKEMRVLSAEYKEYTCFFTDVAELDICDEQAVMTFVKEMCIRDRFMGIYVEKILFVFSAKQYIVVFGVKK